MITKDPINKDNYIEKIYYTSAGRIAFKHLLKNLKFKTGEKILLPAYIGITDREGSGVFDPIQETGVDYDFYSLDKKLSIDFEDFETKIKTGKFKAALIIHYFGFLQSDINRACKICKKNNVLLIEDCAHTLSSSYKNIPLGNFGDFSFFSIHKLLPTGDGGILKINNENFYFPPIQNKDEKIKLETMELFNKSKIQEISAVRIENYLYLQNLLKDVEGIKILYPELNQGIVPMNFPIIIEKVSREKLYFKLLKAKVPTIALYYRIIDAIDPKNFPNSYYLSNNILNLPIHQDISKQDIDVIVNKLIKSLNHI